MQLVFNGTASRFEAITVFNEKDAPKAAGFRWDKEAKRWVTSSAAKADLLRTHADEDALAALDRALEKAREAQAEKAAEEAVSARLSRATDAEVAIPAPPGLEYLGYQRAGIAYALGRKDTLIGDEPGLGKTIQALGFANALLADRDTVRMLVVAPKIALWNWRREAEKWLVKPHSVAIWTAAAQPEADVVIINYDIVARAKVAIALRARAWDIGVFDEAQALKSDEAVRTQACLGYQRRGKPTIEAIPCNRRLFMTGTPILNRPAELYPVLHAMRVPEASSFIRFTRQFCGGHDSGFGWKAMGATNLPELQDLLRRTVMVRRLKSDVLTELPQKRYSVVELEANTAELRKAVASEREAAAAEEANTAKLRAEVVLARKGGNAAHLKNAVAKLAEGRRAHFTEISRLRHATAVAKVPQVVEHLVALLDGSDESVLVMGHHGDVIAGIVAGLEAAGHPAAVITGDTSDVARQAAQDDIQRKRKRVFVGSMKACGVAITLTAASTVVFAEQDWVPGTMTQAEDRAHRIGQVGSVLVQHLVVDGSFDATMAKAVAAKGGVIDAALDEIESDEDRLAREEAAAQAVADQAAEVTALVAAADAETARRAQEAEATSARRAERAAELDRLAAERDERRAAEAGARRRGAVDRAADRLADEDIALAETQVAAVHAGLQLLADMDGDHARLRNAAGFSQADTSAGHYLAGLEVLEGRDAVLGQELVRRYRRQLPAETVAAALGEAVPEVVSRHHDDENVVPGDVVPDSDYGNQEQAVASTKRAAAEAGAALAEEEISRVRDLLLALNTHPAVNTQDKRAAARLRTSLKAGNPKALAAAHGLLIGNLAHLNPKLATPALAALARAAAIAPRVAPSSPVPPPFLLAAAPATPTPAMLEGLRGLLSVIAKNPEVSADDRKRAYDLWIPSKRLAASSAPAARELVAKNRAHLDPKAVADALGEAVVAPPRGRGRPKKEGALSQVERNKAYRSRKAAANGKPVAIQLPKELLTRFRAMRDARGLDNAGLMELALAALRKEMAKA